MTYEAFLERLLSGFHIVIETFSSWINNLMGNYFFITILGLTIFSSMIFFFIDRIVLDNTRAITADYDDYNDLYNHYDKLQHVKMDWLGKNRAMVYSFRYDNYTINKNVGEMYAEFNKKNTKKPKHIHLRSDEWIDTEVLGEPLTPEEDKEITDILDNF